MVLPAEPSKGQNHMRGVALTRFLGVEIDYLSDLHCSNLKKKCTIRKNIIFHGNK
jgi:hypothetical protein